MGRGTTYFFQKRHGKGQKGQQVREKMFSMTNYQGNTNQMRNKIPPHTCKNSYQQEYKYQVLVRIWRKRNLYCFRRNINRCRH